MPAARIAEWELYRDTNAISRNKLFSTLSLKGIN